MLEHSCVVSAVCYLAGNMHPPDSFLSTVHRDAALVSLMQNEVGRKELQNDLSRISIVPFIRHTRELARHSNRWWGENMVTLFYLRTVASVTRVC